MRTSTGFITSVVLWVVLTGGWLVMIRMPGTRYRGPIPPLNGRTVRLRDMLRRDVEMLAGTIGERNLQHYDQLQAAAKFVEELLTRAGYAVHRHSYEVNGRRCDNLEAQVAGSGPADEIVVVAGHYDSVWGSPGANDNATGTAAMLALARTFAQMRPTRSLRFVAFVNEEPPYFQTPAMGSVVYASRCRKQRERIVAMLSLETIGYYTRAPGSQRYAFPINLFYPSRGEYVAFVGNLRSRGLVRRAVASFRQGAPHPSEGAVLPSTLPGVGWSDHWAFWQAGYPGIMVTDTALFRYPHYHTADDTPEKIQYDHLAVVVEGLERVVSELAGPMVQQGG